MAICGARCGWKAGAACIERAGESALSFGHPLCHMNILLLLLLVFESEIDRVGLRICTGCICCGRARTRLGRHLEKMTGRREGSGDEKTSEKRGRCAVEEAWRRRKIVADGAGRTGEGAGVTYRKVYRSGYISPLTHLLALAYVTFRVKLAIFGAACRHCVHVIAPGQERARRCACSVQCCESYYPGYPCTDCTLASATLHPYPHTCSHLPSERSQPSASGHLYFRLLCPRGLRSFPLTNAACGCLHCHPVNRLEALQIPSTSRTPGLQQLATARNRPHLIQPSFGIRPPTFIRVTGSGRTQVRTQVTWTHHYSPSVTSPIPS